MINGLLQASALCKSYRGRNVVDQVSLELCPGEVVGLLGPNGAGKTTTFYIIVGLIAPHMVRMFLGADNRWLIPASALFGATLVMACDTVGRMVMPPSELPVGIILAILGPPFFLWLLRKVTYES